MKAATFFALCLSCIAWATDIKVTASAEDLITAHAVALSQDCVQTCRDAAAQGNAEAACKLSAHYLNQNAEQWQEGARWAIKAAEMGSAQGAMLAGSCYYDGRGVVKNASQAAAYFNRAYELGNTRVLKALAHIYAHGEGVPADAEKAMRFAQAAVKENIPHALSSLAIMYAKGVGTTIDFARAKELMQQAIDQAPQEGQLYHILACIHILETDEHWDKTVPLFQKAAALGWASSYLPLAVAYQTGKGTEQDNAKAFWYAERAVDAGLPGAYFHMAEMYREGVGTEKDPNKASDFYQQAIEQNPSHAESYLGLAEVLQNMTQGHEADAEIVQLLEKAAECGDTYAMQILAVEYSEAGGLSEINIEGYAKWCCTAAALGADWALLPAVAMHVQQCSVNMNDDQALQYCLTAVEKKLPGALASLAACYTSGTFTEQNLPEAERLFRESIAREPDQTAAYAGLAKCIMLQRNNEEAELEAFLLLQKGAECGDPASIDMMAEAYETGRAFANGKRLPADAEKAQMYYNLAEKSD